MMSAKTARLNLQASEERYDIENKKYALIEDKFDIGSASNLELLQAKEALILSEKTNISNKINNIISAINIYKAVGGVDYMQFEELL